MSLPVWAEMVIGVRMGPTSGVATIPPSTFYGRQNQRPHLPNRPAAHALGSSLTGHCTVQPSEKLSLGRDAKVHEERD